jgi:hypothetical protein
MTFHLFQIALVVVILLVVLVGWSLLQVRGRFRRHLADLTAQVRRPYPLLAVRKDLPPAVMALAGRMQAQPDSGRHYIAFEQDGQMWQSPAAKPLRFAARQTVSISAAGFVWRAVMGRAIVVADYLVSGSGGLEVCLLEAVPLVRMVGGPDMDRGETLRYLAELPWNPDAVLLNNTLQWNVEGPDTITDAIGVGQSRCEVTFSLDERGLITRAAAASRPYTEKGRTMPRPWHGRFWDYQTTGGRLLPLQAEVAWVLDGRDFVYWRGRLLRWERIQTK